MWAALPVRRFGILVAVAIGVGFWMADRRARIEGLFPGELLRVAQGGVLAGFLGARLHEVRFNWDYCAGPPGGWSRP